MYQTVSMDGYVYVKYTDSKLYKEIKNLENQISATTANQYFLPRDLADLRIMEATKNTSNMVTSLDMLIDCVATDKLFLSTSPHYIYAFSLLNTSYTSNISYNPSTNIVKDFSFSSDFWNSGNDNSGNSSNMKLRVKNDQLTNTTIFHQIENNSHVNISKATLNTSVYLNASALAGNDGNGGVYTLSAIVFDTNNKFRYYKPLESAKGEGRYEFDLSDIPVGKYKIAIVNEAYNENSTAPAESSLISTVLPLEIVDPLQLSVTPNTNLKYGENANHGDVIASFTTVNGVSPITVTLISDTSVS